MVAICPNNSEVHIYKASASPEAVWERVYVLEKVRACSLRENDKL